MNENMTADEFNAMLGKRKGFAPVGRTHSASGVMNKTEARMADELKVLAAAGEIRRWYFEGVKLKLATATFYTPDFLIVHKDGSLECRETKGHWEDDARVKFKVAAALFPFLRFTAYRPVKGGGWDVEEITP